MEVIYPDSTQSTNSKLQIRVVGIRRLGRELCVQLLIEFCEISILAESDIAEHTVISLSPLFCINFSQFAGFAKSVSVLPWDLHRADSLKLALKISEKIISLINLLSLLI